MKRALWLVLGLCGCQPKTSVDSVKVVDRFYAELRASQVTGAPTEQQLAQLAPFLSDSLRKLLAEARQQHDADVARAPDEKPAFAEGDLFSSLFEGPTEVTVESDSTEGIAHRVLARMRNATGSPPTSWTDTVLVVTQGDHQVIEDIRYGGTWDFALKGTLRSQLSGARAEAR